MRVLFRLIALCCWAPFAWGTAGLVPWQPYGDAAFAQARAEGRYVLLELEAVWCHWCHVMDERTWSDPAVAEAVARHYVPVRADHDARPDLAERYRDYGWPALIILDGEGREIVKRAGYLAPEAMQRLLAAVVADPSPENPTTTPPVQWALSPFLDAATRAELEKRLVESNDFRRGGLKGAQKVVDRDAAELALLRATEGDATGARIARGSLAGARRLLDPVWGGVYQYSTGGDWKHPHYEKLGFIQADYLRLFALSYATTGDPRDRDALLAIHRYLRRFLRAPDGSFYTSQDADLRPGEHAAAYFALGDAARTRRGVPRVDKAIYARENGLLATALVQAHLATGLPQLLDDATFAVERMMVLRRLPRGGYTHGADDRGGPYLADSLAMLRALLALHGATGERRWLAEAMTTADFIADRFASPAVPGYRSAVPSGPLAPVATLDENLALARAANLLAHYSGEARHRTMAESAMRYLATPAVALARVSDPGILIADRELANDPAHLTVVGRRDDPAARRLFAAAARWPVVYKRVEWWDRREGPLPNPDVAYPELSRAAAFVCADGRCSRPLFSVEDLLALAAEAKKREPTSTP
ncbi:MAG: thioredoxin domain-containing protein [Azonexus sp.]|nr:thioredoxin domain-containing protein [Betaproteobacteria bacterium]MBK8916548.1 thioredoxin domain-containing protein [Betaproteobacteria bacterium]MBP6036889.1 thioredoxin domain-containing protein [Azonexus sp.]MBP6907495.1 thioredoxin domain-containing protein [Azonexus sp.]